MRAVPHTFLRALSVGLIGLVAFSLFAFFVAIFFSGKMGHQSSVMMRSEGARLADQDMMGFAESAPSWRRGDGGMMKNPMKSDGMMSVSITATEAGVSADRKVAKAGNLDLQVGNVDETVAKIGGIAQELGGMVSDSHFNRAINGTKSGSVTVRVEAGKFDEAFSRLKGVATVVVSEDVSGRDVTEQFIDLEARIRNKKVEESTLQGLFDRATKISDVMEVTSMLSSVRSEIELLEGQLRYLNSQTDLATISLFLTEDVVVAADQGFRPTQTLKQSFMMLLVMLGSLGKGAIFIVILGVPILLVCGLVFFVLYRIARAGVVFFWPGILEERRRIVRKR